MEEGSDIKASLVIALQTGDSASFVTRIKSTTVPLYNLKDPSGSNIFHELAASTILESTLLGLLRTLITEFHDRYFEEALMIIESLLNARRENDGQTPLLDAVQYNKKVKKYLENT